MSEEPADGLVLPNLIIAGVAKAGTTSLFSYLAAHPEICPSMVKEPEFFNVHVRPGPLPPLEWYAELVAQCPKARYRMEATPHYWWGGTPVISAMKQVLDRPKIIISLRDPVTSIWSMFTFHKSLGIVDVDERFSDRLDRWEQEHEDWRAGRRQRPCALTLGRYAEFLEPWLVAFGDDVRLVFAEDLAQRPQEIVAGLYSWLGLPPASAAQQEFVRHNATRMPRNRVLARAAHVARRHTNYLLRRYPGVRAALRQGYHRLNSTTRVERMSAQEQARLQQWYEEPNRELRNLLNRHGYRREIPWLAGSAG